MSAEALGVARRRDAGLLNGSDEAWFPRWLGPCFMAMAFALLSWWSWGKWADVQIDFGRELYIPWQLSEGEALYRDMAYRNGPLSQYLNALWFALFGVSINTLVYCNLAILAGICGMTYRLFSCACGRFTATVTGLVLLCVFGFSQYVATGNYNYVTPYQHYQTHGLALSIAMILALAEYFRRRTPPWCAVAGGCLGLVFLTKIELFVPAAAASAVGLGGIAVSEPFDLRRWARLAGAFGAAALLPVAGFFAFLAAQMPLGIALTGVLGNWGHLGSCVFADRFYATLAGFEDVPRNLSIALQMFAVIAGLAALAIVSGRVFLLHRNRSAWAVAVGLGVFAPLVGLSDLIPWPRLARALPLSSLVACAGFTALCLRHRGEREAFARWAPLAVWSVYALALLGKMILRARIPHYGFVLVMPATLLLVACLVHVGPALARGHNGSGVFARAIGVAAVAAWVVFFVRWSDAMYAWKDFVVGPSGDAIVARSPRYSLRGRVFALALERLQALMPPDATLLVLPEGIILNYWLRRVNPTRYHLFLPPEFAAFGGDAAMLEDIRAHPPDFVVLVHRESEEFGVGPFGVDPRNGRAIMEWITSHYRRVGRIGAEPFRSPNFGIVILRRRAGAAREGQAYFSARPPTRTLVGSHRRRRGSGGPSR